jgi:diguanylate cyclase (GGDEF)-like protein/PAS domain S-box-containing protein
MKLDIATLSFILFISSIIQIVGLCFQTKLNKSFNGTKYWVFGNVLNVIGVLLFFIRPFIPNKFISIVLANALVILAQILIYIGITLFLDKKVKYKGVISIFLISMSTIFYFTYINDNINCRTIISSIAIASNSLLIAFELLRDKKTSIKISANFLGSVLLFYGVFYVIRSVSTLFYNINSFFDSSIIQSSVLVISICVSYLYSFGLIIMVNQRVRSEEKEAQERFQLIFETSPDAIDISRLKDGFIMDVNDKFISKTGFRREELIGNTTLNLGLWTDLNERKKFISILKRNRYCENFEIELKKKDGTTFIGLTSSKLMYFNGEKYALNLIRDITERKVFEQTLKKNEEKFKAIANYTANLEMWIGVKGELIWINPAVKKFTDYSPEEFMAMPDFLETLVLKSDLPKVREKYNSALNNAEESGSDFEFRYVRKDYTVFWITVNWNRVYDAAGNVLGIRVSGKDITNFKLANDKINVLSQAVEQSPASIVITDLNGRIEYINKRFTDITGYTNEDVIGENPRILKSDYHSIEDYKKLWTNVLAGKEWSGEFLNKKKNGEFYWESAIVSPIFDSEGKINKIIAIKEDISERKRLEGELKKQARTDVLTGLSNRRHFVEVVENELLRNKRYHKDCAFLMLDIDHFKLVNDNFGHAMGDIAIKKLADVFIETVRKTDILGRIGGEEFAILLVETNFDNALKTAERLRLNVENLRLFDDKGVQVKLTISIGVAKNNEERDSLEELMICSDKALYRAKNEGRNRVVSME